MNDKFTEKELATLDAFEDYTPSAPEASLYVRRQLNVQTVNKLSRQATAYVFNQPLPEEAERISSGNFFEFSKIN